MSTAFWKKWLAKGWLPARNIAKAFFLFSSRFLAEEVSEREEKQEHQKKEIETDKRPENE